MTPAFRAFQEIKWNLIGYPLARMLREATTWFPRDPLDPFTQSDFVVES